MNRREFHWKLAAAAAALTLHEDASTASAQPTQPSAQPAQYQIAMLAYPGMTALDLVGPQYAFASIMGAEVSIVARTTTPVRTDTGVVIVPDKRLEDCPATLDVLFVPGGSKGTAAALTDTALIDFVRDRGSRARLVTSVCTGSLILGAAGLLRGHRATSHWLVREKVLPLLGATPVDARVVVDGNRITGAGVSAGLDLGLTVLDHIKGSQYAQAVQLMEEYAPQPPFHAGVPASAGPELTQRMTGMHQALLASFVAGAQQAAAGWKPTETTPKS